MMEVRTQPGKRALAARNLQNYPQLACASAQDPVGLWSDLPKSIMHVLEAHATGKVAAD
jgi:hypothetical protein